MIQFAQTFGILAVQAQYSGTSMRTVKTSTRAQRQTCFSFLRPSSHPACTNHHSLATWLSRQSHVPAHEACAGLDMCSGDVIPSSGGVRLGEDGEPHQYPGYGLH